MYTSGGFYVRADFASLQILDRGLENGLEFAWGEVTHVSSRLRSGTLTIFLSQQAKIDSSSHTF